MTSLERYLSATPDARGPLLADPAVRTEVESWLGSKAFAELDALSPKNAPPSDLSLLGPRNLVFVPGIMGSMLRARVGGMWWVDLLRSRDKLDGLALSSDGLGDADELAGIDPAGIDVSYEPFARAVLKSEEFGLETFAYDWRRMVTAESSRLRDVVLRLHAEHGKPVHLVGHSMGGLLVRAALMEHGNELWPKVGKVVFIGTPHYGAPSIAGYLKNHLWGWDEMAVIGAFLSRKTFRSLRGAIGLLPAPPGVYPGSREKGADHPCANFDMYTAASWGLDLEADEAVHLQSVLDDTAALHRSLRTWHAERLLSEHKERMLMIAGVGYKTLFRLETGATILGMWERTKKITERGEGSPHREGDGRVPLASAELEGVETRYVRGVHGALQNLQPVIDDVFAWLQGARLELSKTAKGALQMHLSAHGGSPAPELDGSGSVPANTDDYDRYRDITPERLEQLRVELEQGRLPGASLARLL